jgi:hypothetical protein
VPQCSVAGECFGGLCCLHLQGEVTRDLVALAARQIPYHLILASDIFCPLLLQVFIYMPSTSIFTTVKISNLT